MIIELIKRTKSFVNKAKIMLIITIIALIAIGITQLVQETQSQELSLTGVEIKDVEGDWNIIDSSDEEILLDESWLINLNRVFNADEIKSIEIAKDDQLIPVEVKKYPEQKKIIVTPENYYLADESYALNISLDNQNKYKMYFNTVGEDSGLIFEHKLTLEEDASNRPKMEVVIKNIQQDQLALDVIGTVYDVVYDENDNLRKLFDFIDYSTMEIQTLNGEQIKFNKDERQIIIDEGWNNKAFFIDSLMIETGLSHTVKIEYELVNNLELWEGFEGDLSYFNQPGQHDLSEFWAVYLEWFILRPQAQIDGVIEKNTLSIEVPSGWDYAITYAENKEGLIDLGQLEFMRWNNQKVWKNFHKAPFILFEEGPFLKEEKEVAGVLIQDVYSYTKAGQRNHAANHQYVSFLSDYIGNLPVDMVLTVDFPPVAGGGGNINFSAYQLAPYIYGYSSMGQVWASAGADVRSDSGPQKFAWDKSWDTWDQYSYLPDIWGTVRLWFGTTIRSGPCGIQGGVPVYLGDLAIGNYHTDFDVEEHRFKRMYLYYLENIIQEDGSEVDVARETGHSFLNRIKPALAFYYLDQRIKEETAGENDLSEAVQYIYQEILEGRDILSHHEQEVELWLEALYGIVEVGIDFESKLKGYVFGIHYGQEFLDLSEYFDIDLDDYLQ